MDTKFYHIDTVSSINLSKDAKITLCGLKLTSLCEGTQFFHVEDGNLSAYYFNELQPLCEKCYGIYLLEKIK